MKGRRCWGGVIECERAWDDSWAGLECFCDWARTDVSKAMRSAWTAAEMESPLPSASECGGEDMMVAA